MRRPTIPAAEEPSGTDVGARPELLEAEAVEEPVAVPEALEPDLPEAEDPVGLAAELDGELPPALPVGDAPAAVPLAVRK